MLSIRKIGSSNQAGHYFSSADYYVKGEDENSIRSEWNGKGAELLGLSGEVDIEKFKHLLDGRVENQFLGRVDRNGVINHKCGWDFTFSAPKSVSILSLLGGDKDLLNAHNEAVKFALEALESEIITRKNQDGLVVEHSTANGIFASFTHTTSRSLDPQLHTHNVLMNITKDNDIWRSIESNPLYDLKMVAGLQYRLKLAELVKSAGYAIDFDSKKGTFEISSVSNELMSHFSKRSREIREKAEAQGITDAKGLEGIALNTRDSKKHSNTKDRLMDWDAQLKETDLNKHLTSALNSKVKGFSKVEGGLGAEDAKPSLDAELGAEDAKPSLDAELGAEGAKPFLDAELGAEGAKPSLDAELGAETKQEEVIGTGAVKLAFDILNERESSLFEKDIIHTALSVGFRKGIDFNYTKAKAEIKELRSKGIICDSLHKKGMLTTPAEFKKERAILTIAETGKEEHKAACKAADAQEYITKNAPFLNESQSLSAAAIAATKDQFSIVQGSAGVGKTTMTDIISKLHQAAGFNVKAFAQTNGASSVLGAELGVEANTIASHLFSHSGKSELPSYKNDLWIVDEASLLGTDDALNLMRLAEKTKAKVVMLGDKDQLSGVQAGRPFELLQANGFVKASLDKIMRQQGNKNLLDAVYLARDRFSSKALNKLQESVKKGDCLSVVNEYLSLSESERKETLLLIPDNETRKQAMHIIRVGLKEKGVVDDQNELRSTVLINRQLTKPEKAQSFSYEEGDIVEFGKSFKTINVDKGDRYQVIKGNNDGDLTLMKIENGKANPEKTMKWNPSKVAGRTEYGVETYKEEYRTFSKGDSVLLNKTIKSLDVKNGMRGTIEKVDLDKEEVHLNIDGSVKVLDLKTFKNLDHAYAVTLQTAQGMTFKNAMMLLESYRRNLVNTRSFYVAISRAKSAVSIHTDDPAKLSKALDERSGDKTSAHALSKVPNINPIRARQNPVPKNISQKLGDGVKQLIDRAKDKLQEVKQRKEKPIEHEHGRDHGHEI